MTQGEVIALIKAFGGSSGGGGGGGSDVVIVHSDADTGALDKTWQEIHDALNDGKLVMDIYADGDDVFQTIYAIATPYNAQFAIYAVGTSLQGDPTYVADSKTDYPVPF